MGEDNMQNQTNLPQQSEGRFTSRTQQGAPSADSSGQAVRQGRTDVVTRRQRQNVTSPETAAPERRTAPDQNLNPVRPPAGQESGQQQGQRRQSQPQVSVVGKPRSARKEERNPQPVIVDSPDIDSKKGKNGGSRDNCDNCDTNQNKEQKNKDQRKFYFQRLREISVLRRMLMLVFGLLFAWCIAPAFFHIRGIGVISSSAVMLFIFLTAMFWHLIDRNWTFKKAAIVSLAGLLFTVCVIAFGIVTGMMLKASLIAMPSDSANCTVVVLGCKAHGDQPSWMLTDRLEKAYAVLTEHPGVKCVVTGGRGDDEQYTEAYVMKKYLVEKGISPDRIYVEELSQSTEENLLYTKSIIKLNGLSENIVIVTDRFHELRARIWAEKSGFKTIYSACCETRSYLVTGYWFREMFGLARLYVFGV